jgi:hypothetical protein
VPQDRWQPQPVAGLETQITCTGQGPTVVLLGAEAQDLEALGTRGFRTCELVLPQDRWGYAAAATRGDVYADQVAGALGQAVAQEGAVAAWGVGGFGVAVAGAAVPFVLRSPPTRSEDLDLARDPPWAHVPGAWWGALPALYEGAVATHDDADALVSALERSR